MKLIRSSNDLSRSTDHDFLMSFAPLRRRIDTVGERILQRQTKIIHEYKSVLIFFDFSFI